MPAATADRTTRARALAAERMRRYRARKRLLSTGGGVLRAYADAGEIIDLQDFLAGRGLLQEWDAEDGEALGDAVLRFALEAARNA